MRHQATTSAFWKALDASPAPSVESTVKAQQREPSNQPVEHGADDPAGVGQNTWSWMGNPNISAGTGAGPVLFGSRDFR